MPVTANELVEALLRPLHDALDSQGITPLYLAKKLKREVNAKETKVFNDKGSLLYSKPLIAWGIRQKARMDAHKLLAHYPPEKHELTGKNGGPLKVTLTDRLKEIEECATGDE